jgi:hypothetical protein
MRERKQKQTRLQAKILGRVERLLGRDCRVNPFPEASELWSAFQEGWLRALNDPLSHELHCHDIRPEQSLQETVLPQPSAT